MTQRKLLCVGLGGTCASFVADRHSVDWDVHTVTDLKAADRLLRDNKFLVGMLCLSQVDDLVCEEVDEFLKAHGRQEWIGVFPANTLTSQKCRDIILGHLFDFHTLPIDLARLTPALGHAYGFAVLREESITHIQGRDETGLVGQSPAIKNLLRQIKKVAHVDAPVLIHGESGSGKELTAHAVHNDSGRSKGPFVPVNCGAIPASLVQSELFGHEKGAFTGAGREKRGFIESAAGGTIFLDEIGDLPLELQTNLLRFLQEKTINRVGSTQSIEVNLRVIAASHVNLEEAVSKGRFREDLYYRLNVLPLSVPPLRDRKEDIAMLAQYFFEKFASDSRSNLKGFTAHAINAMETHNWPGNVRELSNRIRRAMAMADGRLITHVDLNFERVTTLASREALIDARTNAERSAISTSLQRTGKNITQTAKDLGVSRMTLYRLMEKHGINT